MAKQVKVKFLKHINSPRVLVVVDMDIAAVSATAFAVSYGILSNMGILLLFTLLASLFNGYLAFKIFSKVKEETTKGFIWHWLYEKGIWRTKEKPEKFPELKRLDFKHVIPDAHEREFED